MNDKKDIGVPKIAPMENMKGLVELNIRNIFDTLNRAQDVITALEARVKELEEA